MSIEEVLVSKNDFEKLKLLCKEIEFSNDEILQIAFNTMPDFLDSFIYDIMDKRGLDLSCISSIQFYHNDEIFKGCLDLILDL